MHPADQEKDTATLRYDRFLSSDGTQCEVREAYTGPQGLTAHRTNVTPARCKPCSSTMPTTTP
jgi:hypothetical protein